MIISNSRRRCCIIVTILGLLAPSLGCPGRDPTVRDTPYGARPAVDPVHFVEIANEAGIDFHHVNGARGKKYMPETVGSGVAFLDYDNDGWQDILIVNGKNWPGDQPAHSTLHLYHNNGNGTFADVTKAAGLDVEMFGMGVAVGDFDNDGYEDIFVTAIGSDRLFRNTLGDAGRRGGPVFEDVTARAGVQGVPMPGVDLKWKWSASAAWIDYDKDGKLDLFVCQYVKWSPKLNPSCGHNGILGYCPPGNFEGSYCWLYHNDGGGHFREVGKEMGIRAGSVGKSFGVVSADYNGDGWPDLVVTNDTWANYLFLNDRGKRFIEQGAVSGIATGESGHFKAGMGIDTADWRNNGHFALLIGNFSGESLSLYETDGKQSDTLLFTDNSHQTGIAEPSLTFLTFGLFFFDYDLDGWQDVFTANGHVDDVVSTYDSMLTFKERPLLYHNKGKGTFEEVGVSSGLTARIVGRGAACGDIDNDGDLDIALVNNGGNFLLYRNEGGNKNHWIRLRTEGTRSNRDGIGTLVRVTNNGVTQSQYVHSGGSFLSESQRQPTFGLGGNDQVERIEVVWPSGTVDRANGLRADKQYLVTEGQGFHEDPRTSSGKAEKR